MFGSIILLELAFFYAVRDNDHVSFIFLNRYLMFWVLLIKKLFLPPFYFFETCVIIQDRI